MIVIVIGAGAYYLRSSRSGRELYAIGSNPDAARLAGIPVVSRFFPWPGPFSRGCVKAQLTA